MRREGLNSSEKSGKESSLKFNFLLTERRTGSSLLSLNYGNNDLPKATRQRTNCIGRGALAGILRLHVQNTGALYFFTGSRVCANAGLFCGGSGRHNILVFSQYVHDCPRGSAEAETGKAINLKHLDLKSSVPRGAFFMPADDVPRFAQPRKWLISRGRKGLQS